MDSEISDYSTITSEDFGKGKTNTATMIAKWNAGEFGEKDKCSEHKDMWGQIQTEVTNGWFVPSKAEWSAFAGELGISKDSSNEKYYGNFAVSDYYWSSSLGSTDGAWFVWFDDGYMFRGDVNGNNYVRLSATF